MRTSLRISSLFYFILLFYFLQFYNVAVVFVFLFIISFVKQNLFTYLIQMTTSKNKQTKQNKKTANSIQKIWKAWETSLSIWSQNQFWVTRNFFFHPHKFIESFGLTYKPIYLLNKTKIQWYKRGSDIMITSQKQIRYKWTDLLGI